MATLLNALATAIRRADDRTDFILAILGPKALASLLNGR